MSARDALRRYLEQRRELGESELVLDSLSVEDVLALVGLKGGAGGPTPAADDVPAPADHPRLGAARAAADESEITPWGATGGSSATSPDGEESSDWRTLLRAAGGAPAPRDAAAPSPKAPPPAAAAPASPEPPRETMPRAQPAAEPAPVGSAGQWDIPGVGAPTGLVVGGEMADMLGGPGSAFESLSAIAEAVAGCTRCPLFRTATHAVPGEGNPNAELVVVGEAPGAEEDASGRPFVGASGQLLTKILAAISLSREDVFICNVVKHRPPGNRNPEPDEVAACSPYLVRQLELIRPKAILTLGNFAAQTLLGTKLGVSKLRGQVHRYHGIPLVATYHPAALLRNPTWKRPTWEDVQLARRILDRADAR